jgi:hypothetical protein
MEKERLGSPLANILDEKLRHNAVFYAVLIPEEARALDVVEYLIGEGVEAGL